MARSKPVPSYAVRPAQPDDHPVWELVRTRGKNSSVIAEYTLQAAADMAAATLNAAAPYED
ncbi:hypothetical protein [Streptomyces sp. NPDC088752]|uniref:hypothetical protein n=1 Tax=Streptomyces sp. NPDC088752 TaxID=3154963 RepID=UPI00343877DB